MSAPGVPDAPRGAGAPELRGGPDAPGAPPPAGQLDPMLLEVLACPAEHHAPLRLGAPDDPGAAALTCTECGRVFPIRDGIPVLLLDEALDAGVAGAPDAPVGS